jgi:hypothetical protein
MTTTTLIVDDLKSEEYAMEIHTGAHPLIRAQRCVLLPDLKLLGSRRDTGSALECGAKLIRDTVPYSVVDTSPDPNIYEDRDVPFEYHGRARTILLHRPSRGYLFVNVFSTDDLFRKNIRRMTRSS